MEKKTVGYGEKLVYGLARVLAVGVMVIGIGAASLGLLEAWEFFTEGARYYTPAEEIVHGVLDVAMALIVLAVTGAMAGALWNLRKIVA